MAHLGDTIINGSLRVIGGQNVDTINGVAVGTSPKFTDTNTLVTQTATSGSANYEVLFSATADNTTRTEGARKNSNLTFNPSTGVLTVKEYKGTYQNLTLTGTGTAATTSGSNYIPAKWTFNSAITAAEGDVITIVVPVAGHSYGVFLSVNNGTNYYPVNIGGTGRLTTHYGVGTAIQLVFDADGSTADMFPLAGGTARTTVTGGCWRVVNFYDSNSNTIPSAYCDTAAATAAKVASCTAYALLDKSYLHVLIRYANTSATALTLNINSTGAKSIYINGTASSTSNYTLPAGTYLVYYASNIFYFRTDGKITGDITGNAATVNGLTVQTAVPSGAKFTDTNNAVTQTATTTNADYEVLFSVTADNTTRTEGARKNTNLKFNPSTGNLTCTSVNGLILSLVT